MIYEVGSTGVKITVPAGFVTDYASIPRPLWSLYSPHDQYSRASVIHDYLYWSQLCTRQQADNLFMIAMKESEVPKATRETVYRGVTAFGQSAWDENARQRRAGKPRVVPVQLKNFPPNWSWEMYREKLVRNRVKDPKFSGGEYCALGDTADVPVSPKGHAGSKSAVAPPRGVDVRQRARITRCCLESIDWRAIPANSSPSESS
ncbi:DUF1353 domain-containing protein [Pararobbsia alpina]